MKYFFIVMVVSIGFVGCNKNKLEDIEKEVGVLQNDLDLAIDQHNVLMDSISALIDELEELNAEAPVDVNAIKVQQIASLFESIARQPEASNTLIAATEMIYTDYTELLPFSEGTVEGRGIAMSMLFEAIARQPGAYKELNSAASRFLGEFDPLAMLDDFTEGKARGIALVSLFEGIARQPYEFNKIDSAATKYLGVYNASYFSDDLLEVSQAVSMSALNESLARQPEADTLFNKVCIKYLNFKFLDE